MSQIMIVDYGAGNLRSVLNSLRAVAKPGEEVALCDHPEMLSRADRIVLPGVGAYRACKNGLEAIDGMIEALDEMVGAKARPFLGICVGMQLMVQSGDEHGVLTNGLGWIDGHVRKITPASPEAKIPHMGWNDLRINTAHPLLDRLETGDDVYFVHSYSAQDVPEAHIVAATDYDGAINAVIGRDNIIGTQFHPEKSQRNGLRILRNFLDWQPA